MYIPTFSLSFQEACVSLREKIVSAVKRVDENLDLDSMFDMDEGEKAMVYQTYTETMHLCYNFGFEVNNRGEKSYI